MNDPRLKPHFDHLKDSMDKAVTHAEHELSKIRAGKAHPGMLDAVKVDYYGNHVPLSQVANVNTPDARTITIQPWEKNMIQPIEKAILVANLGFNPSNDGTLIRVAIPALTEERRKEIVKLAKHEAEAARVSIRNIRKDVNEHIKKTQKDGVPEDEIKNAEAFVQKQTDACIKRVDELLVNKEKEIMHV